MVMDVNLLRVGVTLLSLAAFVAIVVWAWSRRNSARFAEAAQLPFADEARDPGDRR
jgi:cytochrome c oxidase cbb3-type subunit IV